MINRNRIVVILLSIATITLTILAINWWLSVPEYKETNNESIAGKFIKKEATIIIDITDVSEQQKNGVKEEPDEEKPILFTESAISDKIFLRIKDISYKENSGIEIEDLRYLEVTYLGFDNLVHYGEMIVHKNVSEEVLSIFKELYALSYQIDKINLVDDYNADDNISMADNNTSAFNSRFIAGTNILSNHGYGLAIDINPIQNPYIKGKVILPIDGEEFIDRKNEYLGMILKYDACYTAFISRGWSWGGDWNSVKDYQHFEKLITDINN